MVFNNACRDGLSVTAIFGSNVMTAGITLAARPFAITFVPEKTALIVIDMQRDFIEPGGFGAALGNDVTLLRRAIKPVQDALTVARALGILIIHTREGHRPDLTDAPPAKLARGNSKTRIGSAGPMGRILVRGEPGHDIIPECYPQLGEPILDKPGKGCFYQTDLDIMLRNRGIEYLLVCGVTTEVCVHTTVREANDRGFRCIVLGDACASYFPEFHDVALRMISAQGGIFGWVSYTTELVSVTSDVGTAATPQSTPA
jgi:nicotinamidase-related amidase